MFEFLQAEKYEQVTGYDGAKYRYDDCWKPAQSYGVERPFWDFGDFLLQHLKR